MLQNLTRMAADRGINFVADKSLEGKKYAVKFKNSPVIYCPPAVYALIQSDPEKTLAVLIIKELSGKGRRRKRIGGTSRDFSGSGSIEPEE